MDLLQAKSRVAKALVESILRRARYSVSRFVSDQPLLRIGREEFTPDFHVQPGAEPATAFPLEVKYRPDIEQVVSLERQRGERSVFAMARRQWPALCFVLVTDHPPPGRSCFQVVAFDAGPLGRVFRTVDLADVPELRIFPRNVEDHETLLKSILGLLSDV